METNGKNWSKKKTAVRHMFNDVTRKTEEILKSLIVFVFFSPLFFFSILMQGVINMQT